MALEASERLAALRGVPALRYAAGVLLLAAAYYAAGQASLALQYTGPVAAIWLPVGVGAAVLYLAGPRWWPGVLIGDLALPTPPSRSPARWGSPRGTWPTSSSSRRCCGG